MSTAPKVSLTLFLARTTSKAAILRRGPSKLNRLILWDRADDSFEDGQWLKTRVYEERCDISADGAYFLFFAFDATALGAYTAISRPPYFTALALYPQFDTWGGGGRFLDDRRYLVHTSEAQKDTSRKDPRLERVFKRPPEGSNTFGYVHTDGRRVNLDPQTRAHLSGDPADTAPKVSYHVKGPELWRADVNGNATMIRDFSDMEFEPIKAPYDTRPETAPLPDWHPLDDDRP